VCGIAGFTHRDGGRDPDRIWQITRSLNHRGPDEQSVWESGDVSLGAVRLKIIDLEHGQQPMVDEDGDTVLAYNGEIYNHLELRRELAQRGHRFVSQCDTETLLHAFLEWDTGAFSKLRGMFAAAFWTQSRKRLVLVRDRMGIKPLYVAQRRGHLYFGSEVKTILAHPAIDRQLSATGLHHYLSMNYVPQPATMVEGVEKLAPGHWMEWRDGRVSVEAYWKLEFAPDNRIKIGEAKEELDGLLRQSIREHLVADVPLGVWSSGGLDSSTMVHYAAEQAPQRLKTFSISFHGRKFDESAYFRQIAERYGTEHHEFNLDPSSGLADAIEEFSYYSDEPSADAGAVPVWFLSKMTRREATVALSGEGADEIFGGYSTYLANRYARGLRLLPLSLRRWAGRATKLLPVSDEKIGFDYKLTRMLQGSVLDPVEAHHFWNGTFSPASRRLLLNIEARRTMQAGEPLELPQNLVSPGNRIGYLNRFLWLDQKYYLPDDILYKSDRMSMAHSLEVRPPFLDHRIVEFAARLPQNLKIRGGKLKFVLRELMKDRLPEAVVRRKKEGFDIPAHDWLRTVLRPLLLDTLNERSVRETGIFSWPAIDATIRAHLERRANLGYHLWGLLVLFLWMRRWGFTLAAPIGNTRALGAIASVAS
jgi:asparagine synthase (glutamine-hydrolysing)